MLLVNFFLSRRVKRDLLATCLALVFLLGCEGFRTSTKDSNILIGRNVANTSNYSFTFPFNATSNINDTLYAKLRADTLLARHFCEKYIPKGLEELRAKFGLYKWSPTEVKCSKNIINENCKISLSSEWSDEISHSNGDHFTEMISRLDPYYDTNFSYRFKVHAIVKVYVDNYTQLVHYDAMLFLSIQRKIATAPVEQFSKEENQVSGVNRSAAIVLDNEINSILYRYYLNWIENELGPRKI